MENNGVVFIALYVPVWETRVRIFIGDGTEDGHLAVKDFINKNFVYKLEQYTNLDDLVPAHCQGTAFELEIKDGERRNIKHCIYLKGFNGTIHDFSILNHELYHLVNQALRMAGVEAMQESEEAYTYMYDWLTEKVYAELVNLGLCNKFREPKYETPIYSTLGKKPKGKK